MPTPTPNARLGVWSLSNALRTTLPWNLPAIALVAHALIAAANLVDVFPEAAATAREAIGLIMKEPVGEGTDEDEAD